MGMETMEWYNNFCLIGHTDKRSKAWHYMESMQGDEPNHYTGGIPYADVVRRLFSWKPRLVRTANMIPTKGKADAFVPKLDSDGNVILDDRDEPVLIPVKLVEVPDKRSIVRSDNYLEIGRNSTRYRIHDYEEWLLKLQSNVIGDTLDIWSAILLRNGAQACVQVALPETIQEESTGLDFVSYCHCYTSLDGSLATTFAAGDLLIVCDNTMYAANRKAEASGRFYRSKHTEASLSTDRISEVKQALSLIHQNAESSMEYFKELGAITLPDKVFIEVMDVILPPANEDDSNRAKASKERKREHLWSTYLDDPMANTWKGTLLGGVQAFNTYATHYVPVRGNSRVQRNAEKIVDGSMARLDKKVMNLFAEKLDLPDLAVV